MKTNLKKKIRGNIKEVIIRAKLPVSHYCKKPDFLIIGAQKAGTTSLYNYLFEHPQINLPIKKEIHFFDLNFIKGPKWYLAHYPLFFFKTGLTGEATPYYLFHPFVAERVYELFPDIKLIVMIRNPVDRAFSHFQMEKRNGRETAKNFKEALLLEEERKKQINIDKLKDPKLQNKTLQNFLYQERGKYADQISNWLRYFPLENFHFIIFEEFFTDPNKNFEKVCSFLNIRKIEIKKFRTFNKGNYDQKIDKTIRKEYMQKYFSDLIKLEKLIGRKTNWGD